MSATTNDDGTSADARDEMTDIFTAVEALRAAIAPIAESFREAMAAAAPKLREFALGIARTDRILQHWQQHAPMVLRDAISVQGLIVPISQMSFRDLVGLLEIYRNEGDAAVVRCVRRHYDEIFGAAEFFEDLESTWAAEPRLLRRLPLLQQALIAHKLGMFGVAIPTLIAQFEGFVADVVGHVGPMNGPQVKRHVATLAAGENVTGEMLSSFVNHALFAQFGHGSLVPPISRHAILHGGDVDYATEVNSRTAILLVDHVRLLADRT